MAIVINTYLCGFGSDGAAALLSACSLVCCCSHQFVFPCLEVLLQGTPPPCTISCKALPRHSVDVDSLHISYADIFITQVRAAGGSPPQCQLTVEDVFWNVTILHTTDMTQPSQSALSERSVHTAIRVPLQFLPVRQICGNQCCMILNICFTFQSPFFFTRSQAF